MERTYSTFLRLEVEGKDGEGSGPQKTKNKLNPIKQINIYNKK